MQLLEPFHHPRGLELEHALRITVRIYLVGLRVVDRNFFYVNVDTESLLYLGQAYLDDRQCPETQEVHLEHTHVLDERTLILRYPYFLVCGLVHTQGDRDIISQVSSSDNHRTCVDTYLTYTSFELKRIVKYLSYKRGTIFVLILQFRNIFHTVLECRLLVRILLDYLITLSVFLDDSFTIFRLFTLLQFYL